MQSIYVFISYNCLLDEGGKEYQKSSDVWKFYEHCDAKDLRPKLTIK